MYVVYPLNITGQNTWGNLWGCTLKDKDDGQEQD